MSQPRSQFRRHRHDFVGDGLADQRGADRCASCGLPKRNKLHQAAPVTVRAKATTAARVAEAADRDRRIVGDR